MRVEGLQDLQCLLAAPTDRGIEGIDETEVLSGVAGANEVPTSILF